MRIGILGGAETGATAARLFAQAGHEVGISSRALTRCGALDPVREGST
jgi:predicted dinucleotide-binding enzyme